MSFFCIDQKAIEKLARLQAEQTFEELEELKNQVESKQIGHFRSNYLEKHKKDKKAERKLQNDLKILKQFL